MNEKQDENCHEAEHPSDGVTPAVTEIKVAEKYSTHLDTKGGYVKGWFRKRFLKKLEKFNYKTDWRQLYVLDMEGVEEVTPSWVRNEIGYYLRYFPWEVFMHKVRFHNIDAKHSSTIRDNYYA